MTLSAHTPQRPSGTRRGAVIAATIHCLNGYVDAWVAAPPEQPDDAGPAVLAALAGETGQPAAGWGASRALTVWLHGFHRGNPSSGLYRGHAGYVAGLTAAALSQHRMRRLLDREVQALADRWTVGPATRAEYTVGGGLAGAVLALSGGPERRPDLVVPLARRLAAVRDWPGDMLLGLSCGLAGVASALRAAVELAGPQEDLVAALRRTCDHLLGSSTVDSGWADSSAGVAWSLWEAGRVLDDGALQRRAAYAMDACCTRLLAGDLRAAPLDFWSGLAGTLALADAFTRYAHLPSAGELRDRAEQVLIDRLSEVDTAAADPADRHTLAYGAPGVLAVLLTVAACVTRTGANRGWLIPYGLR